jgi:hypothetical protein
MMISSHASIVSVLVIDSVIVMIVHCCVVQNRCVSDCSVKGTSCVHQMIQLGILQFKDITICVNVLGLTQLRVLSAHSVKETVSHQNVAHDTSISVIQDSESSSSHIHTLNSFILLALFTLIVIFGSEYTLHQL